MPARPTAPSPAAAAGQAARHWLMKTEPSTFSFDDLWHAPDRTTAWSGVRNYQVRNYMRDNMQVGDLVFIYHSSAEPTGVAGIAEVVSAAYPDATAFDPADQAYDPKSTPETPIWYVVDVRARERFPSVVTLAELRETPGLEEMFVVRRGNRLSVTPVTADEWTRVCALGRRK